MNKWVKRLLLGTLCSLPVAYAAADWNFTPGAGGTFFSFICQSTKICGASTLIDSSGAEKGVQSNPVIVNPSGSTPQPVTGTVAVTGNTTAAQGVGANTSPWFTTLRQGGFDALVTSAGRLAVDIGSSSLTGTVTANQGAASGAGWLMQPGNTANTTPWLFTMKQGANTATVTGAGALKVDNTALTQPISGTINVGTIPAINVAAAATGGCTGGHFLSAPSNNATAIKSGAGTLCELVAINTTASTVDLRLYDVAGSPTCSSATGVVANYVVQPNTIGPGFAIPLGPFGKAFTTGIGICLTASNADNDNTNAVTGVNVNWSFK